MKVRVFYQSDPDRPITDPLPEKPWSIIFRLYWGDICDPSKLTQLIFGESWFGPRFPSKVWRTYCKWPILPFIAWRFKSKGGYIGFKVYGVDSPQYKQWSVGIHPDDVFDGSLAMCLTFRPFATMKD